jgi:branched-chain amino acid transport system ATP-binding protein
MSVSPEPASEGYPLLSVVNLEVRYGAALALSDVSLDLRQGVVMTVLGSNGAGKSTLARACSGLVPPTAGKIFVAGQDVTGWSADRIRRIGLIHVPEGRGLFPNLTVLENLRLAVRLVDGRLGRQEALERAFSAYPVLATKRNQRAGSLSGGQQQMVSLARVVAVDPKLVIIDEPSLGLGPKIVESIFESLESAKALGVTIILIEQFVHRALALSDWCVILRRGRVAWQGPATEAVGRASAEYLGADEGERRD